jgi:tellurite resistance protein
MAEAAEHDASFADNILIRSPEKARAALELLVAEARIDGEICDEERSLLVRIAGCLDITGNAFQTVYESGIERADRIRKSRQ